MGYNLRNLIFNDEIELPQVQRGLVWNPIQIEYLWDSILRGFPIGALILYQKPNSKFDLLDGQQRRNAISLGFNKSEDSRVWIDLLQIQNNNYLIRFTSRFHPWGFKRDNGNFEPRRFSSEQQRKSLILFFGKEGESKNIFRDDIDFSETWPCVIDSNGDVEIKKTLPVPLDIVLNCLFTANSYDNFVKEVSKQLVKEKYWENFSFLSKISPDRLKKELHSLIKKICHLKTYEISILVTKDVLKTDLDVTDCFKRITSAGTQISELEQNYSAIKVHWNEIKVENRGIKELCENRTVQDYQLANLCFRLAFLINSEIIKTEDSEYQANNDGKWKSRLTAKDIINNKKKIDFKESVETVFINLDVILREIEYWFNDDDNQQEYAIPTYLRRCLSSGNSTKTQSSDIFLLLMWLAYKTKVEEAFSLNSKYIISLSLFLRWFSNNGVNSAKEIYKYCSSIAIGQNQSIELAISTGLCNSQLIHGDTIFLRKPLIENEYETFIKLIENNYEPTAPNNLRNDRKQKIIQEQEALLPFVKTWECIRWEQEILLFWSRKYLQNTFPNYTAVNKELWETYNRPWDIDHIIPSAWLAYNRRNKNRAVLLKTMKDFIGNQAPIPYEINRSKNDEANWDYYLSNTSLIDKTYESLINQLNKNKEVDPRTYIQGEGANKFLNAILSRTMCIYKELYSLFDNFTEEGIRFNTRNLSLVRKRKDFFINTISYYPNLSKIRSYIDGYDTQTVYVGNSDSCFDWTRYLWIEIIPQVENPKVCIRIENENPLKETYWIGLAVPDGEEKDENVMELINDLFNTSLSDSEDEYRVEDNDSWYISLKKLITEDGVDGNSVEDLIDSLRKIMEQLRKTGKF